MKNIKLVVRENLIKKITIQESLEQISMEEDYDNRMQKTIDHVGRLMDEGYDNEGIERHFDEQFDFLNNLIGMGANDNTNPIDNANKSKLLKLGGTSIGNQMKQWMIKKFIGWTNLAPEDSPLSNGLAYALSEMSLMDLISVFRSKQGCYTHSQDVARGVLDGVIAAMRAESGKGGTTIMGNFLQNIISQALYNQGTFKKIGVAVCNFFWNKKSKYAPTQTSSEPVEPKDSKYKFSTDLNNRTSPL